MGAYLSEPITDKVSSDETGKYVKCGASSMQGWRVTQEDAHNCIIEYDENTSMFAVYDGHGGHEVAQYCSQKLPLHLRDCASYKNGDYSKALEEAFLGFDATLIQPDVVSILKQIVKSKDDNEEGNEENENSGSEDEENIRNLYEEAQMPLEEVMAKYQSDLANPKLKKLKGATPPSPFLLAKQSSKMNLLKAGCSSDAGGSSSSSCSSSAEPNSSTCKEESSEEEEKIVGEKLEPNITNGKEKETNGEKSTAVETTNEENVAEVVEKERLDEKDIDEEKIEKSEEIADTKQKENKDIPESTVVDINSSDSKTNESPLKKREVNGTIDSKEEKEETKNKPHENGDMGDETEEEDEDEKVSPKVSHKGKEKAVIKKREGPNRAARQKVNAIFQYLLTDSDSDDEGDESFQGAEDSSSNEEEDDDEEEEQDEAKKDEEEGEEDNKDNENEEEGTEEEEEDEDEEEEDLSSRLTEEPGVDSGCTAVVAVLHGRDLYVANAGDSRCVVCRGGEALDMSLDHKPEDDIEMKRIVAAGGYVTCDGRVKGGLNLSRAIGDHAYKQSENLPAEEQMITALPDVRTLSLDPEQDEFMILACDGIWNFMSSQEVINFVRSRLQDSEKKLSAICEELFDFCLAPNTAGDGTGCDNMTAVIIQFLPTLAAASSINLPNTAVKASAAATGESQTAKRPASPLDDSDSSAKRVKIEEETAAL